MDFGWSETQKELYTATLELARNRLGVVSDEAENRRRWREAGRSGILGGPFRERWGGLALDALTTARIFEALGEGTADLGFAFGVGAHVLACAKPIEQFGSDELKNTLLRRLISGDAIGANALSEDGAGSDAMSLRTRAEFRDGRYYLNGSKSYVTNAGEADVFLVYAVTDPTWGYMGISAFAMERGTSGLRIGLPIKKIGLKGASLCSIYMEDCELGSEQMVGKRGQGAQVFRSSMLWERSCLFAIYVGMLARQLAQVVEYARTRRQFGRSIGQNQGISHKIARMRQRLESARLLLYRSCWLIDQGKPSAGDIGLAKVAVSEAAIASSLDSIQIHGGIGCVEDAGISAMLEDAIPSTIFSGTTEIQLDLIASELGL